VTVDANTTTTTEMENQILNMFKHMSIDDDDDQQHHQQKFNTMYQDASVECRLKNMFCMGLSMYLHQNESRLKMELVTNCHLCKAPSKCIWHTNSSSISTIREILFDLMVPTNTKKQFELLEYILRVSSFEKMDGNSRLDAQDLMYMYHNMVKWLKYAIVNTEFNTT
jgi:hypothetical protein